MPDDLDETRDLALRFLRVFEYMGKYAKHRVPHELAGRLRLSQLQMIGMLNWESGISQKDLAERLQLTPAAISTSVREMERYGIITRHSDPSDARLMRLSLSDRGRQMFDEGQKMRCVSMADLLSALPLAEQRMVVELLERALAARLDENKTNIPS